MIKIISQSEQGDSVAFEQLFESLYPKLIRFACQFIDDATAEDMVQEVFLDYWEQKLRVDIINISSYLYKNVQNKCLNHIKHQLVVESYSTRLKTAQSGTNYLTNDIELFKQISDQNIREIIESSVERLPPKCQEAFRLCYIHEMTCKEAAGVMGLSPRTVEGHVQKAVNRLRKYLNIML